MLLLSKLSVLVQTETHKFALHEHNNMIDIKDKSLLFLVLINWLKIIHPEWVGSSCIINTWISNVKKFRVDFFSFILSLNIFHLGLFSLKLLCLTNRTSFVSSRVMRRRFSDQLNTHLLLKHKWFQRFNFHKAFGFLCICF